MTNSQIPPISQLIERLREETDNIKLAAAIDDSIDAAVEAVIASADEGNEFTIKRFHATVTNLAQRIGEQAMPAHRRLTDEQAFACALQWLEKHYISRETRGYAAALLDAMEEPWDGIHLVCRELAEAMKQEIRWQVVSGALTRLLAPLEWRHRVDLVRDCLTEFRSILPAGLTALPPEQLVDELPQIILVVLSIDQPIRSGTFR